MIAEDSPQRERPPELDPRHRPRLRAPTGVQHHVQDAVDAEPGVPETTAASTCGHNSIRPAGGWPGPTYHPGDAEQTLHPADLCMLGHWEGCPPACRFAPARMTVSPRFSSS